jgi:GNAT superfamily N-acetyltransferase
MDRVTPEQETSNGFHTALSAVYLHVQDESLHTVSKRIHLHVDDMNSFTHANHTIKMSTSDSVTIRPREISDVPALIDILTDVYNLTKYPVDGPRSFPSRFTSPNALHSLVALHDGKLAGHAEIQDASKHPPAITESLVPLSSYAAFVSLFVDPKIQGKGIGAKLVEESVAWGRANGKRLVLIVLDKDVAATRMYEKLGWVKGTEYPYETKEGEKYGATMFFAPV